MLTVRVYLSFRLCIHMPAHHTPNVVPGTPTLTQLWTLAYRCLSATSTADAPQPRLGDLTSETPCRPTASRDPPIFARLASPFLNE
jgi:hypothetical protein